MKTADKDDEQRQQLEDAQGWLLEFQNESDRAAAVLGAAFLDAQLEALLKSVMKDEPKEIKSLFGPGGVGGFTSRARLAYCLDLISRRTFEELQTIAQVRNKFAHRLQGLTFQSEQVLELCKALKLPEILRTHEPLRSQVDNPRFRYIISVALTHAKLGMRQLLVEKVARPQRSISALIRRYVMGIRGTNPPE